MAVVFSDNFESYTLGEEADDGGPLQATWDASTEGEHFIISNVQAVDGSQSMQDAEGGNSVIALVYGGAQPHGSAEFSFYKTDAGEDQGIYARIMLAADMVMAFGISSVVGDWTSLKFESFYDATEVIVPGIYAANVWQRFKIVWRMSTVLPDGSDVAADGCCRVYLNSVLIVNETGLKLALFNDGWVNASSPNHWDTLLFNTPKGFIDAVTVTDDVHTCTAIPAPPTPPTNESAPCCGDKPGDPGGPNNPGDPPVFPPLQPWDRECLGGGIVPTADDVLDLEAWSL